jgi:hypothetical protein
VAVERFISEPALFIEDRDRDRDRESRIVQRTSGNERGIEHSKTNLMKTCIGSSASLPVSFSINPDPKPLIWTRVPVSAWMYLTNIPWRIE